MITGEYHLVCSQYLRMHYPLTEVQGFLFTQHGFIIGNPQIYNCK